MRVEKGETGWKKGGLLPQTSSAIPVVIGIVNEL